MYPYHNRIKQSIRNGELIGHYFGFRKGIGEYMELLGVRNDERTTKTNNLLGLQKSNRRKRV